jgi:hypothetical protein
VRNATITRAGSRPALSYSVQTDRFFRTTRVSRTRAGDEPVLIGVVEQHTLLPDTLTLSIGTRSTVRLSQFIKTPLLSTL